MFKLLLIISFSIYFVTSKVYFEEEFKDEENYLSRWVESTQMGDSQGVLELSSGKSFGDAWRDKGLQTSEHSKFYGISVKFNKKIDTFNKSLVIQYQLKMENPIECGGGYIKILESDFDQATFHSHTPYRIMFGPDICGHDKRIIHLIINYKDKYYVLKKDIKCKDDQFSHLYTLIIFPSNSYKILIDNIKVEEGLLSDDFDFYPIKKIKDPSVSKPKDWNNEKTIPDINDSKPNDWDQPETIVDRNASKPKDYDKNASGEWEPPLIKNPDFKGEWNPRNISNPNYTGPWVHPLIDNPDFVEDMELYRQTNIGGLGFDIWQVVGGSIFDNILVTDDPDYAYKRGEVLWKMAFKDEMKLFEHKNTNDQKQKDEFKTIVQQHRKDFRDQDNNEEIMKQSQDNERKEEL